MGPASGEHAKGHHAIGDSNAGAIAKGGRAGTGKEVRGTEAKSRAGADEPTAKGRSAGSAAKRALAAQQAQAKRGAFDQNKKHAND